MLVNNGTLRRAALVVGQLDAIDERFWQEVGRILTVPFDTLRRILLGLLLQIRLH
jgi:hypothetical protein